MNHVGHQFQRALYQALNGSSDLTSFLGGGGVHDLVPKNAKAPYVAFTDQVLSDWSTGTEVGFEITQSLDIRTRTTRRADLFQLMDAINRAVLTADIQLDGYHLVHLQLDLQQVRVGQNRRVQDGLMRFRALIEAQ